MSVTAKHAEGYERRWWILVVLCMSLLIIGLDNTVLNVAIPTLVRDLGASNSELQWIVDAYILVFAGLLLTAGSISDRFGRRSVLSIGLGIFGIGSIASAFAVSATMLIATRAMMGIGGAMIMPSTLSILTNIFPPEERGRAIGIWAGVSGMGIGLGPLIGGALLDNFWWGSVFLINVPIVIIAITAGRLIVPNSKAPNAPKIDPVGAGLSIAGLVSLVFSIIEAPTRGWTDPVILAGFALAAVILSIFVWWESHSDHPMLNVRFFENPRFTAASLSITLVFFAMFGSMFFLSQYLQFLLKYTPLQAGVRQMPVALVMIIVAPMAGLLVNKLGNKILVSTGMVVAATGLFMLSRTTVGSDYWNMLPSIIVLVIGMSLTMTPATESIMGSLPKEKAGVGSAMNDTTRQIGGALGVAILGSVFSSTYVSGFNSAAFSRLPAGMSGQIKSSVGGALEVAARIGGGAGQTLYHTAASSFITGMDRALVIGSLIALSGALIAMIWLPNRPEPDKAEQERMEKLYAERQHQPGTIESPAVVQIIDGSAPADRPVEEGPARERRPAEARIEAEFEGAEP